MIHVIPSATLPIVRQIADPSDTSTYYVRAVIRDSVSGTTLSTVNLVGQGSQRFTYNYPAPADPSGQGRYIDITTTVYSDSGYTTRTGIYADEVNTYLVKDDRVFGGGGGGGAGDFSYREIRKIIKEELAKIEFPEINIPNMRDVTPDVLASERRIKEKIDAIRIPEQIKPDMDKVVANVSARLDDAVNTILIAVDQKEVTPPADTQTIIEEIQALPIEELKQSIENATQMLETLQGMVAADEEVQNMRTAAEQFVNSIATKKLPQKKEVPEVDIHLNRARSLLGNRQMA